MLLRTQKLISSLFFKKILLRNHFCHSKPNISMLELQKQKADLSFEIYLLILTKPKGLDLEKKSLHDLIMEKIYQKSQGQELNISHQQGDLNTKNSDEDNFKYHEEARKPFIDLFEKGYLIDSKIFPPKIKQEKIESNQQQQKFIFHPTYLITSQVFYQLDMLKNGIKILAGSHGISKTVSVCLFWHLAKFIDEYRFQEGVTVSKDMMKVPKLVYWTLNLTQDKDKDKDQDKNKDKDNFKKIILDQCPEILRKLNLTDETQYNWRPSIKEFYQKNYPGTITNIIIDQFNFLAQLGRIYQKEIKDIFQNRRNGKYIKTQDIQNEEVRFFFELKEKIESCIRHFHGVLGLSPTYLENKFFEKQIMYTTSTNTMIPPIKWVQYSTKFYKSQSLLQIADYFIFEMNQRIFKNLKNTKVSQETQKEMKKQCFDELIMRLKKNKYFFFTLSEIVQKIIKLQDPQSFDKPIPQLKNEVKKIFQDFVNISTQKYKKLLIDYLQKQVSQKGDKEKRIKIMFSIYNYLINNIGNGKQFNEIEYYTRISKIYLLQYKTEEINKFIDERLLQFNQYSRYFELMLPTRFFVKTIQAFVDKDLKTYLQVILQLIKTHKYYKITDLFLEYAFLKVLNKGNVKFSFDLISQKQKGLISRYQFDINNHINTFESLQKATTSQNSISVSILDRFHQTIRLMRQKNKEYAAVYPVRKSLKQNQSPQKFTIEDVANYRKMIDLALIKNDQANNLISIWLIDLAVQKDQIQPKIHDFMSQFLKFQDKKTANLVDIKNAPKVEINYAVFGPKNDINHNNLSNTLKEKFGKQITFKTSQESNAFTVQKLNDSESCLLKRIAYIDLGYDFEFDKKSKNNNEYLPLLAKLFFKIRR